MIVNVVLFLVVAVFGGLASSWYMIEKGSGLTTRRQGPWTTWVAAGRSDADPYTRAHHLRRGTLPVSSALAQTYEATADSDGNALFSSCDYVVEGAEPEAAFWSLAVFDERGNLIANPAERYSFNSATLMRTPGGRFGVTLSRSARPGNWLPTGGGGRLALQLRVEEPKGGDRADVALPVIRRTACR